MFSKYKCLRPVSVPSVTGSDAPVFRCGKCAHCLKTKANELAVRAIRECNGQSIGWITLTYDNEHCPIKHTIERVDEVSGEIITTTYISPDPSFFADAPFEWIKSWKKKQVKPQLVKRYHPHVKKSLCFDEHSMPYIEYHTRFFTINIKDVQDFFKRFRMAFGKNNALSRKYILVPEYGGAGYRPHYHFMIFSPTDEELEYIRTNWKFGHVDVDFTKELATARKISVYVSKYSCKGKYDCPYIAKGLCNKPRRCSSINFGVGDLEELKSRLFACTDITDPFFNDDLPPEKFSKRLLTQLQFNRAYKICDEQTNITYNYPFPKYLIDKVMKKRYCVVCYTKEYSDFDDLPYDVADLHSVTHTAQLFYEKGNINYKQDVEYLKSIGAYEKTKYKILSSPLQAEIKKYLLADVVHQYQRELRQNYRYYKDSGLSLQEVASRGTYEENEVLAAEQYFRRELVNGSIF